MAKISKVNFFFSGIIIFLISCTYFYFKYMPDNYMWQPVIKSSTILENSCYSIIAAKTFLWTLFFISIIATLNRVRSNKWGKFFVYILIYIFIYLSIKTFDSYMNANNFYNIFINQTVSDDYILVPVVEGGYYIGKFLNHDILDSSMQKRRYAIEGLGLVDFKPAIKNLELIIEND